MLLSSSFVLFFFVKLIFCPPIHDCFCILDISIWPSFESRRCSKLRRLWRMEKGLHHVASPFKTKLYCSRCRSVPMTFCRYFDDEGNDEVSPLVFKRRCCVIESISDSLLRRDISSLSTRSGSRMLGFSRFAVFGLSGSSYKETPRFIFGGQVLVFGIFDFPCCFPFSKWFLKC